MKSTIYIAAMLLLGSFVLILMDDFGQEWKQVQRGFSNIEENRFYSSGGQSSDFSLNIKQIDAEGLGRVDRCPTCHLGISSPKYQNAAQPYRSHPGNMLDLHKEEKFGCTACHLGQGYAVSYATAAHQKLDHWNETMLPKPLIQASCGSCHHSIEVPEADLLTRGRELIIDKGCTGCHDIADFFQQASLGPDLSGVGNKVKPGWLYFWLKDPRNYLENSRMPTFSLSDDEIVSLMSFLLSLNTKDSPPRPINAMASESGDEDQGKILVGESRCISCHSIEGRGGTLAPELDRVGDKIREDWAPNFLRNVHYYQPEKIMLEYNFSDQDALDVAAFLLDEYSDEPYQIPDTVEQMMPRTESQQRDRIAAGRKLFAKHGCDGCHTIDGKRLSPKVGPKLTKIGNRLEAGLDFGSVDSITPTLYNWLFMKVKQPDIFDSSSIMPNFHLTDEDAFMITLALLGNREYDYASEFQVPEKAASVYKKPAGDFGQLFERYSCISCHSIDKYGGNISTVPLTYEGSKVKYDWLKSYLMKPYAIRPIVTARMPRFRMTERQAALMADYIKKVYVSDSIPSFFEYELKRGDVAEGRSLFTKLECSGCHIIGKSGGYVGPALDGVGSRLEAGWIYAWLKDPLKYKPETIHPDYSLTDQQARELTAFLVTKTSKEQ